MKRFFILLIFFLGTALLFSQETLAQNELLKKAKENRVLLDKNPKKAFEQAKKIEKEAQKINAREAEIKTIITQCVYYKITNDFENLKVKGNLLFRKAEIYKMPVYAAFAKNILFEAYVFGGLPDKAFQELEQGFEIISKINSNDPFSITTKADLFIAYSNYYELKHDYKNQLKYLKLCGEEVEKLPEGKRKKKLLHIHYANIGSSYRNLNNQDSAKYYAKLSLSKYRNNNEIEGINLSVLGDIAMKEADYKKSLFYFKEAEKLEGYQNHLNREDLYDNIIRSYQKLKREDSIKLYQTKKNSLRLNISENQNKFLHKLLDEKEKEKYQWYVYTFIFLLVSVLLLVLSVIRKNSILAGQEEMSRQYLKNTSGKQNSDDYSKLLEMFKKNDLAFMTYFEEVFPGFTSKILNVNPDIIQSEIEFFALLKLKISTKDIARYKYIEPKTVRNKKYMIKKKLGIPKEKDIYQWFNEL